jgi:hypothetical protein
MTAAKYIFVIPLFLYLCQEIDSAGHYWLTTMIMLHLGILIFDGTAKNVLHSSHRALHPPIIYYVGKLYI